MAVVNTSGYVPALKKLIPLGPYWDKLLADDTSDVSLICTARADELAQIKKRMNVLLNEAYPTTAEETITAWERVYLGYTNETLTLTQRRDLLLAQKNGNVTIDVLQKLAGTYGCTLTDIYAPYTAAFCGHAFFGRTFITTPAALSVLFIRATAPEDIRPSFESAVERSLLANQILFFFYGD